MASPTGIEVGWWEHGLSHAATMEAWAIAAASNAVIAAIVGENRAGPDPVPAG